MSALFLSFYFWILLKSPLYLYLQQSSVLAQTYPNSQQTNLEDGYILSQIIAMRIHLHTNFQCWLTAFLR